MTIEAGRLALSRGAWEDARRLFEDAIAAGVTPEALEGLGLAAWWLDRADLLFDAREHAYRLYREQGNPAGAARVAVWLAWDSAAFRGEGAVANGWLQSARRLLDGLGDVPERAWLELRTGVFAILEDSDPERARAHATEAIRVARALGHTDFEMVGRALDGFAQVTMGQVAEGLSTLDEVNASVLAGEVHDWIAIGLACCYLIAACERIHDFGRAIEWCTRLTAFCKKTGLHPLFAVCRTQYASVCMWRGTWAEAERELLAATDELAACRPAMTAEGLVRLADLRRRQGRGDEALTMLDQSGGHPSATLYRAELMFDCGELQAAANLAERYLRRLPVHNRAERAPGLELLARAGGGGNPDRARAALAELGEIATTVSTVPLRASASLASGFVAAAEGHDEAARRHFEDAVDRFQESGAPFETGRARLELASVLARLGQTGAARLEADRAIEQLAAIDAAGELARARAFVRTLAEPAAPAKPAGGGALGLTSREVDVLRLVSEGLSNQAIAERLGVSEHTVHRHVANILTKLDVPSRAAAAALAARHGLR